MKDLKEMSMDERFFLGGSTEPSFKRVQVQEEGGAKLVEEWIRGSDPHGNEILVNRGQPELAAGINRRDELLGAPATRTKWAIADDDIIRTMNNSLNETFKFTLTFEDYELRIGTEDISHAAIEGNGNYLYTAGKATIRVDNQGKRILEITNVSGHYRPSLESNYMADPIWRSLQQKGLRFESIKYLPRGF